MCNKLLIIIYNQSYTKNEITPLHEPTFTFYIKSTFTFYIYLPSFL